MHVRFDIGKEGEGTVRELNERVGVTRSRDRSIVERNATSRL